LREDLGQPRVSFIELDCNSIPKLFISWLIQSRPFFVN